MRHLLYKCTACVLWRISEAFEFLWGFFELAGNWFEDWIWTADGPDLNGFRWLFTSGKTYRNFDADEAATGTYKTHCQGCKEKLKPGEGFSYDTGGLFCDQCVKEIEDDTEE